VGEVKKVTLNGTATSDYEKQDHEISFNNPIDISETLSIQFHFQKNDNVFGSDSAKSNPFTYNSDIQEHVRGHGVTIKRYPVGLETIKFSLN
jgi:hypothetical protein